ncbi:MAG: response regulator [Gammaproteobacteria bacterium]|nr:response regulator [Gammaproteobacteria bacterium]
MHTENIDIKSGSILIVDDEPANIMLVEQTLMAKGYKNVSSTLSPVDAVELCRNNDIDLILLDLDMPILDGFGVMTKLNEMQKENKPVILVLTAQIMQEYKQQALDSGARDYVTKPFNLTELLSRVRNLLEIKLLHNLMLRQNQILEEKVQQRTANLIKTQENLHNTRLQVVQRLGLAAEYRDNETGYHIIRMSKISALLGKAAGMSTEQCDLLLNASPMHDIGKIGIPDKILLKPGKFEPEEWRIMQTHAQIGADILSGDDSDLLSMAREIALTHHEKWNGSGYPNALCGEDIPLVGRISALADVFDALSSERPYKKAWPLDKAIELIKEERGKHFDPKLVDIFLEHLDEIVAIREKYSEPEIPAKNELYKNG